LVNYYQDKNMILQVRSMIEAAIDNALKQLGNPGPAVNGDPAMLRAGQYAMPARNVQELKQSVPASQGQTQPLTRRQLVEAAQNPESMRKNLATPGGDDVSDRTSPVFAL